MPARRIFTQSELDCARDLRRDRASWRAIGRALGCNEETIRTALDPDFGAARTAQIIARRRERRAA